MLAFCLHGMHLDGDLTKKRRQYNNHIIFNIYLDTVNYKLIIENDYH